jgi:mannose-6-phosphate isomerase-like protein (cupin superfamily)
MPRFVQILKRNSAAAMNDLKDYMNSGILEEYVLGLTSETEDQEVCAMALEHPEIQNEIDAIAAALTLYGETVAPELDPTIKPMVMATIDYTERLKGGEAASFPPELTETSTIADFETWINRDDMQLPDDFDQLHLKLIGCEPQKTTGILWLKYGSPEEIHHTQFEKFLVLEGSCEVTIDGKVNPLAKGDYLQIPLHLKHDVRVTSTVPCKVILQRLAA